MHKKIEVKYKKGFVAFLDILGFKEMVLNKNLGSIQKIENYLNIVNEEINKYKADDSALHDFKSIVISDSIILSMDILENDQLESNAREINLHTLRILCLIISSIQAKLANVDIFLRGAISFGDIYFDDNLKQIVGDGYINAYLLEETHAIYPRVILDNKIVSFLKFETSGDFIKEVNKKYPEKILYEWNQKFSYQSIHQNLYGINKDVPLFIDYVDALNENELNNFAELLKKNAYLNTSVYPKYKWLANYLISKINHEKQKVLVDTLKDI